MTMPNKTPARRLSWLAAAAALVGAGWGSNEITPMLLVYHRVLNVGDSALALLFGVYALGLMIGLVVAGPVSDARGRRSVVALGTVLSWLASVLLIAGSTTVWVLMLGRLVAGLASGAVFGGGTAWMRELSLAADPDLRPDRVARRAVVAMTTGFAAGPIVAGVLAQWAPADRIVPYLPHVAFMAVAVVMVMRVPPTPRHETGRVRFQTGLPHGSSRRRWWRLVVPIAPWVFAAPAVAFGFLPTAVGAGKVTDGVVLAGAVTAACALAGVLAQPLAARLAQRKHLRPGVVGLIVLAAGLVLSTGTLNVGAVWMLFPTGIMLGVAYGLCLVDGLVEVQRIAEPSTLGALTASYYAITYLGFAAPYLLTALSPLTSPAVLLTIGAGLAVATAVLVTQCQLALRTSAGEQARRKPPLAASKAAGEIGADGHAR